MLTLAYVFTKDTLELDPSSAALSIFYAIGAMHLPMMPRKVRVFFLKIDHVNRCKLSCNLRAPRIIYAPLGTLPLSSKRNFLSDISADDQVALGSLALAAFMHYEATSGGGILGKGVLIGFLTCAAAVACLARLWALAVTMKATMALTMVFPLVGTTNIAVLTLAARRISHTHKHTLQEY